MGLLYLFRVKEQRNILRKINIWKATSTGNMWRRDCLLQHVTGRKTEGKVEIMENNEDDVSN